MSAVFAVDLGESMVKLAYVTQGNKALEAKAFAVNVMPHNIYSTQTEQDVKITSTLISKLAAEAGIKQKEVTVIIPDSHSYSRIVEMPRLTTKELVSAIRYQADQLIPIPIDRVSLDIETLSENKKEKKIMILLVAAPISIVDKVVDIVESAGLIPLSVETETSTTLRLVKKVFSKGSPDVKSNPFSLFVNFGYSSTSLYLYSHTQQLPILLHNFSVGVNLFIKDVEANYNIARDDIHKLLKSKGFSSEKSKFDLAGLLASPYNELVAEIERFISSSKSKFSIQVQNIYLFGEGVEVAHLPEKLTRSLGINVSIFDPSAYFVANNVSEFFKTDMPLFIPAIGGNL